MERNCKYCGAVFEAGKDNRLYCSRDCMLEKNRDRAREAARGKHEKSDQMSIVEVAVKARQMGLTYGQYVAKFESK